MDLSKKKKSGFTLIELMIVVAIIGILAALAIPAFLGYVRRSKSTEVTVGLDNLFKSMSTYYSQQNASSIAVDAATTIHCSLAAIPWAQALPDTSPNDTKRLFPVATIGTTWGSVKGAIAGYVYYSYYFDARPSGCDVPPGTPDIYTFRGAGNLDNDAVLSSFSIAAGSDSANVLYRARAFNVVNELE